MPKRLLLGCRNVYYWDAETFIQCLQLRKVEHTLLSCVSASGSFISPMLIYPQKRAVFEQFREGEYPR